MSQKVLIADDDPLMHQLYGTQLARAGCQVLSAADGEQAVQIAGAERPDVIIMDVIMGEMDGFAALRQIRKDPIAQTIPVIIITASLDVLEAVRKEAQSAGASAVLTKPFSPQRLLSEIKRLTGK
jgi:CheY-like chemotaxis protein